MVVLKVLLFVLALGYGHSAYVDTMKKCALADKGCHKELIQKVIKDIAKTGMPEYKIPPIDPIVMKKENVSIPDLINLFLDEVTVTGVKNSIIDNSNVDIEHLRASIDLTCDVITILAKYSVHSTSEVIKTALGGPIHGDGNGKLTIKNLKLQIGFPFEIIKRGDDYFFKSELKKLKFTYKILGGMVFDADNLYLSEKESSKEIIPLLNQNWKTLIETSGSHFFKIALKYIHKFLSAFFENVPTRYYLTDDIGQYYA